MQMFEKIFICPENAAAAAIAKQITISPDVDHNPFFIHGNTGLGKTHLLTAIKEQLHFTRPEMEVIYVTVDELVEKFIYSIQTNTQLEFKTKYRNSDIIMIDDLDNIKSKPETQKELLYIIRTHLYNGKQVILSSCESPLKITLNNRTLLRSDNCIITKIDSPGYNSRLAFLEQLAVQNNYYCCSEETLSYIAKRIHSNFATLGSVLNSIYKTSELSGKMVTMQIVKSTLRRWIN